MVAPNQNMETSMYLETYENMQDEVMARWVLQPPTFTGEDYDCPYDFLEEITEFLQDHCLPYSQWALTAMLQLKGAAQIWCQVEGPDPCTTSFETFEEILLNAYTCASDAARKCSEYYGARGALEPQLREELDADADAERAARASKFISPVQWCEAPDYDPGKYELRYDPNDSYEPEPDEYAKQWVKVDPHEPAPYYLAPGTCEPTREWSDPDQEEEASMEKELVESALAPPIPEPGQIVPDP